MDQYPIGEKPLSHIEAVRLRLCLRMLFVSEVEVAQHPELSQTAKLDATDVLADVLADPEANRSAAEIIISRHASENNTVTGLYRYYSFVKRARELHPDSALPDNLLTFIKEMAEDQGETDIAHKIWDIKFETMVQHADTTTEEEGILIRTPLTKIAEAKVNELLSITSDRSANLANLAHTSAQHSADKQRLAGYAGDPHSTLEDIKNGYFTTPEGLEAAKAQQDSDRLSLRKDNPHKLLEDINYGYFTTPEGLDVAKAQQDSDRLAWCGENTVMLGTDLRAGRFLTQEGIAAARRLLDLE